MNKYVLSLVVLTLLIPAVAAHSGHVGSEDPLYVRVTGYDAPTFTFTCYPPEYAGEERHWTVRTQYEDLIDTINYEDELTVNLTGEYLYHIGCEVPNSTDAVTDWIQSDFHIDLRTEDWTDRPNIEIISSDGPDFTASCTHPTATDYELHWYLFHPATGADLELVEYLDENVISYTVPELGLWDLGCGVWDKDALEWTQWGLPIEFFDDGPAYVPNALGCFEEHSCPDDTIYVIPEGEVVPTIALSANVTPQGSVELHIQTTDFTFNESSVGDPHKPGEGHVHLYIDDVKVSRLFGPDYTIWGLGLGEHEIQVRFATNDHKELKLNNSLINDTQTVLIEDVVHLTPPPPQWLEPSEGNEDVDSYDFHIHIFEMPPVQGHTHIATDYELWDSNADELVWASLYDTEILTHIHNADGIFQGNLAGKDRLEYNHSYKLRARYYTDGPSDNVSEWSEWRNFRTAPQYTFETSPFTWTAAPGFDVQLVAEDISMPVNVQVAPQLYGHLPESQQPLLYVTQLYGQLGMIRKDGTYVQYASELLNYDVFGSLPGSGEAGVTGLYVDPTTGDLFVSLVYNDQVKGLTGKVERYHTNTNGDGYTNKTIIMQDIPTAPSHQVQSITRGPDGKIYLNTGDDDHPFRANDPAYLSGKILRMNEDGSMPADNPVPGTYIYASGFRNPFGAAWNPEDGRIYVTNNGPDSHDGVFQVEPGHEYGWCQEEICDTSIDAWHTWLKTVAPVQLAFDPGIPGFSEPVSEFDTDDEHTLFVAISGATYLQGPSINSKRIVQFRIDADGNKESLRDIVTYSGTGYGTPIGLAFSDDALYFTDIYGETGFVGVGETAGRIYKVVRGNQTNENQTSSDFHTVLGTARWYPQGRNVIWECKPEGGSGNYLYDFYFGDGQKQLGSTSFSVYHTYPALSHYTASCTVHDLDTEETTSAQTTIALGTEPVEQNASLTVTKIVINDNNGTSQVEDFTLFVSGTPVSSGEANTYIPDTYTITEDGPDGYTATFSGDCDLSGQVVLLAGDEKECIITNNDVSGGTGGGYCASSVYDLPVTCDGVVAHDIPSGCRSVTCELGPRTSQVMACNKPGDYQPQYFEIYRTNTVGAPLEVCFGSVCIGDSGFKRSEDFPICEDTEPPVCTDGDKDGYSSEGGLCGVTDCDDTNASINPDATEVCDGIDNNCQLGIDEGGVCSVCGNAVLEEGETCDDGNTESGDGCSSTCQTESSGVSLSIADWFPQGLNVVLVCEAEGSFYEWTFGDGAQQAGTNSDVWHTYPSAGTYQATCTVDGVSDSIEVTLA